MIWAEKTVAISESVAVQDIFESLFMRLGGPAEMMMISTEEDRPDRERVICSLPNEGLLDLFDGFEVLPEEALPRTANLLVARPAAFEARFGFPS